MYIFGTSTLSEIVIDITNRIDLEIDGFFDDFAGNDSFHGFPVLGGIDHLLALKKELPLLAVFVAIGDNRNREKVAQVITGNGISLMNIIHPAAYLEPSVKLGVGNLVIGGCYIGSNVVLGDNNLIFPGVCITHHNHVGDCNFFSPNVSVGGYTHIGSRCKIGMNSVVKPYLKVKDGYECDPLTIVDEQ